MRGLTSLEYSAHSALQRVVLWAPEYICQTLSAEVVLGQAEHPAHPVVDAQAQQVPVVYGKGERGLGERPVHVGRIDVAVTVHRHSYRTRGCPSTGRLYRNEPSVLGQQTATIPRSRKAQPIPH